MSDEPNNLSSQDNFSEIDSLSADDLGVEQLEERLEMAVASFDLDAAECTDFDCTDFSCSDFADPVLEAGA